jgi:hypothetical protein
MKLRISGNSIRLRLTRSEVEGFAVTGSHENSIDLAGGPFVYRLEKDSDVTALSAELSGTAITVRVPATAADRWTGSEDIGIDIQSIGGTKITIEKDFACLKPRPGEDTEEHYPHPAAGLKC